MKQNIQQKLAHMYRSIPEMPRKAGRDEAVKLAKTIKGDLPKKSSLLWFVGTQIRFINIKVWIFQILLLIVYGFFIKLTPRGIEGVLLLVPATPIVVFIGTSELSRSFRYAMAEMEMATRFSLREILLARLIIIGIGDVLTFTGLVVITGLMAAVSPLILYAIVPCLVTAWGCLWIMNRVHKANSQYYTAAFCIGISVVGGISINLWQEWYVASAQGIWLLALAVALFGVVAQAYKMLRNCAGELEHISSTYGGNYGTDN